MLFMAYVIFFILFQLVFVLVDFSGSGADMDIVASSVRAYLNALNKMCSFVGAVKTSNGVPKNRSAQTT